MNYEKPFATSCGDGLIAVGGVFAQVATFNNTDVIAACDTINAAVVALERKAAAKALREAAEYIEAMTEDDSLTAAHVSYTRARAAAIEKGDA